MKTTAPVAVAGVLGAAILGAERFEIAAPRFAVPCGVVLLVAAGLAQPSIRAVLAIAAAATFGIAGGARLAASHQWPLEIWPPDEVTLIGTVADDANGARFSASVLVDAQSVGGRNVDRLVLVTAGGDDALRLRTLRRGDAITVRCRLRSAAGDIWAERAGAVAIADDADLVALIPPRTPHLVLGSALRDRIEQGLRHLADRDRALLRGFLLGDTSAIEPAEREQFRAAGLSHLLAVSGANVAFVLTLAGPLLRRVGHRTRSVLAAGVVIVFAAATRFEPSVLRASTMVLVVLLARMSGRSVTPGRALAYAVFGLLVFDPALVHSVGFRLSVAATAGIVVIAPRLVSRLRGPTVIRDALSVTLAAQLAVAPLLIVEFGSVPLVAVITNVLAAPAAEPLTIYGLLIAGIAPSIPARLAAVLMTPCSWPLAWVRQLAVFGARVPVALDGRSLAIAVVVAMLWSRRRHRSRRGSRG